MKLRLLAVLVLALLLPPALGCGGGGGYQDRDDVDPNVSAESPDEPV